MANKAIKIARLLVEVGPEQAEMALAFYKELGGRKSNAGRPKGSKNKTKGGGAEPKKLGRPKGSKNKTKGETVDNKFPKGEEE